MNADDFNNKFKEINGYDYHNNIVFDEVSEDEVVAHVAALDISLNPWGIMHGGLIFGLADIAIGTLCYMNKIEGVTIDSNINYLKPCKNKAKVIAKKIKIGKRISLFYAEIYNEKDELSAVVSMNYCSKN